jgi:hypothetical protein
MSETNMTSPGVRTVVRLADQPTSSVDDFSAVERSPTFTFVRAQSADLVNIFEPRPKKTLAYAFENSGRIASVDPNQREREVILALVQTSLVQINRSRRMIEWSLRILFGLFILYLVTIASVLV